MGSLLRARWAPRSSTTTTSWSTSPAPRRPATRTRRSGPAKLLESRVTTTRALAEAIAASDTKPRFLAGNGIGYYGDHGDQVVTDDSDSRGDSLLARVTRAWQAAAEPARRGGRRVVTYLRT